MFPNIDLNLVIENNKFIIFYALRSCVTVSNLYKNLRYYNCDLVCQNNMIKL